jgi:ATP-binding protein involved in chromosome partitioning
VTSATIDPPTAITRKDNGLVVSWDAAADRRWYDARWLRLACPCAQCVEEMTGRPLLDPATVPLDVRPVHLALIGTYGIRIDWSDGHNTGIYTFAWLRQNGAPETALS